LGTPGIDLRPAADAIRQAIGDPERIVFLLLDGLGMNIVRQMPAEGFMASHLKGELLSVVPSTTASALASLATAAYPAQHAVPGWFTYLPDFGITTTILPFVERYTGIPLAERGIAGEEVLTHPSWLSRFPGDALTIQPELHTEGAFARFMRGGTPGLGYRTVGQAMDAVTGHVERAKSRSFTFVYLPQVDTVSHIVGPMHEESLSAARTLEKELEQLADRLQGKARIIVSADHGQLLVPHDNQIELFDGDPLLPLLEVPLTGEGRLPLFHVPDDKRAAFEAMFEERFGDRFALLGIGEAEGMELLGPAPMDITAKSRFGQYSAIPLEDHTLTYLPPSIPPRSSPIGRHGALTPEEMLIPLIIA
jgi:hypothetical protein